VDRADAAKRAEVAMNEMVFAAVEREIHVERNQLMHCSNEQNTLLMTSELENLSREELLRILVATRSMMMRDELLSIHDRTLESFTPPEFYDAVLVERVNALNERYRTVCRLRRGERG
jgi:hypothetical protein